MDRNYIAMHLVVDRYLQGSLTDDETAAFEERLAWDQELIDELELAERLREGLRDAVRDDKFADSPADAGTLRRLTGLMSVPQYAAAASFALAFFLSAILFMGPEAPDIDTNRRPAAAPTEIVPLIATRNATSASTAGGPDVQQIMFYDDTNTVLLIDVLGTYPTYRVTIEGNDNNVVWSQDNLRVTYLDTLAITLPPGLLNPGPYTATVEGTATDERGIVSYPFVQRIRFNAITEE